MSISTADNIQRSPSLLEAIQINPATTAKYLSLITDVIRDFRASGSSESTTGTIAANSKTLTIANAIDFKNDQGVSVANAGPAPTITAPTSATATAKGTAGTTTIDYTVAALDGKGGMTAAFAFSLTTANATLSGSNYVALSVTAVSGASGYAWYRTSTGGTSPTTTGLIAVTSSTAINDTGLAPISPPLGIATTSPQSALGDLLVATIVAGAGTTTLTLDTAASSAVSLTDVDHDDTAAWQSAVNSISATGGIVYAPAGTYSISETISIASSRIAINGSGMFTSSILAKGPFDAFQVSNAASGVRFAHLTIESSRQYAGAGITMGLSGGTVYTTLVEDVLFQTYDGIRLYATNTTTIIHCRMNCIHDGLYCGNGCRIVRFTNAEVSGGGSGIFLDGGSQSIKLLQLEIFTNGYAVALDTPNGGTAPDYVYMYDIEANPGSNPVGPYFYINQAGEVHMTECWSDGGPQAIQINSGSVTIIGGRYGDGNSPIIGITGGDSTTIMGSSISGSSKGTGIGITGGGNIRISDCIFGLFGDALYYAVTISSSYTGDYNGSAGGTTGNIVIANCSLGPTVYQQGNGYDIQCAAGLVTITSTYGANPYRSQSVPAVPASGTALKNPFPVAMRVFITGGTVSAVAISGTATGLTSGQFTLAPGESITLTYTAAPTWTWFGL